MPAAHQRPHQHPYNKVHRLKDAAQCGQLIHVKCNHCRKSAYYLASDLAEVFDPEHPVHKPLFPCKKCDSWTYLNVTLRTPNDADYGHLPIRRPGPVKKIQMWENVRLGDDVGSATDS